MVEDTDFVKPPYPLHASKRSIEAFAEEAAERLELAPGDLLEPALVRLGGQVDYVSLHTDNGHYPDSIVVEPNGDFRIFLPTMTSAARDRFTLAHELGHYFLHFPIVHRQHPKARMIATRWVDEDDEKQKAAEREANWFAAAFLMPSSAFGPMLGAGTSLDLIAGKFAVSRTAVDNRCRSLGLAA